MNSREEIGLIFDLDGTLIKSAPAITSVANEFLGTLGLPSVKLKETISFIGGGSEQFVRLLLESRKAYSQNEFATRFATFSKIYVAASPELNQPFMGAEKALREMAKRGHPLALCTNKPAAPTHQIIEALGWGDLFGAIVAGDTLAVKKPNPAPLFKAAKAIGCRLLLYVGDSEVDAATAEAAAQPFVLFTEGYRKTAVEGIEHAANFSEYSQLGDVVGGLLSEPSFT